MNEHQNERRRSRAGEGSRRRECKEAGSEAIENRGRKDSRSRSRKKEINLLLKMSITCPFYSFTLYSMLLLYLLVNRSQISVNKSVSDKV